MKIESVVLWENILFCSLDLLLKNVELSFRSANKQAILKNCTFKNHAHIF